MAPFDLAVSRARGPKKAFLFPNAPQSKSDIFSEREELASGLKDGVEHQDQVGAWEISS